MASEAALALQRAQLARDAAHAEALREADRLKTALMASISHDLKTPLAAIKAAISSILDASIVWTLQNAWPTKITSTDLKSDGSEVAVETLEIAHEGITMKTV